MITIKLETKYDFFFLRATASVKRKLYPQVMLLETH